MRLQRIAPVLLAVAACGTGTPDQTANQASPAVPSVVRFVATDFAFTGPADIPAGLTTVRLVNEGAEPHHIMIARMDSGVTLDSVLSFYRRQEVPDPAWMQWVGGVSVVGPADSAETMTRFEPGQYAVLCFIANPNGMHLHQGMAATFGVAGDPMAGAPDPTPTTELRMTDFAYSLSQPLVAGPNMIRVVNEGAQGHEATLFRLDAGKTMADFGAWMQGGLQGPQPGLFAGGYGALEKGRVGFWPVTLEAGSYVLVCFVPDDAGRGPHAALGMIQEITIN